MRSIKEMDKRLDEREQEIERLNKELEKYKYSADELNEIERLNNIKQKAINELFNLKDMIYKLETREINFDIQSFDIQRKISSIIRILILGKELKGSNKE